MSSSMTVCKNIENNPVALRQIFTGLINFDYKAVVPSLNFQDVRYKPSTSIEDSVRRQIGTKSFGSLHIGSENISI